MYLFSVADLRAEGIGQEDASDERLELIAELVESYVESKCGWWFESRAMTLQLDGSGTSVLDDFPAPIISISSMTVTPDYVGAGAQPVDLSTVVIYNRRPWLNGADDRYYPKVEYANGLYSTVLYDGDALYRGRPIWTKGTQNVQVVGSFGFTDKNGKPPAEVRLAARRLAQLWAPKLSSPDFGDQVRRARITSESTDGHSYSMQSDGGAAAGFVGDPMVDRMLARYSRPPMVLTTAD